jgi:hypothetical protein
VPAAATILRRARFIWGLGHLALGDRRGWLLLGLQVASISALAVAGPPLIEGSRWILLLPALLLIVMLWVAQAIHAHQKSVELGGAPGGELQIAWLLPLIVVALTAFWLVGGQRASPTATLQQYVAAWHADRAEFAASLFHQPMPAEELAATWDRHEQHLVERVTAAEVSFGAFSGLDPARPFDGLRFVELADQRSATGAAFAIEITRRERIETTLFGLLPTATQQTVLVERLGVVRVIGVPSAADSWLPARRWLIEAVEVPTAQVRAPETRPS